MRPQSGTKRNEKGRQEIALAKELLMFSIGLKKKSKKINGIDKENHRDFIQSVYKNDIYIE